MKYLSSDAVEEEKKSNIMYRRMMILSRHVYIQHATVMLPIIL